MAADMVEDPFEPSRWRYLRKDAEGGSLSLAADQAILTAVSQGKSPATLKISRWHPGYLSLGADQDEALVDEAACKTHGWEVVRRQIPGRAVLHVDGLSLSIFLHSSDPLAAGPNSQHFELLSAGLKRALKAFGLDADRSRPPYRDTGPKGFALFDGPSKYEVNFNGRKLCAGEVQTAGDAIMMRGYLPLAGDLSRIAQLLKFELPGERLAMVARLGYRAATLQYLLGREIGFESLVTILYAGFSEDLNVSFEDGEMTEFECTSALALQSGEYSSN